jgi:hypothetical protein
MQRFVRLRSQTNMKQLFYILCLMLLLGSCSYPCGKSDGLRINFVSYQPAELYNFSISRYEKGTNFSQLLNTVSFDSAQLRFRQSNDTFNLAYFSNNALLPSHFDYKIFVPSTNSTYTITDLKEPQETGIKNGQKVYCMNQVVSCKVNGTERTISYEALYLKK